MDSRVHRHTLKVIYMNEEDNKNNNFDTKNRARKQ